MSKTEFFYFRKIGNGATIIKNTKNHQHRFETLAKNHRFIDDFGFRVFIDIQKNID